MRARCLCDPGKHDGRVGTSDVSQDGEGRPHRVLHERGASWERGSVLLRTRSWGISLSIPAHYECWAVAEGTCLLRKEPAPTARPHAQAELQCKSHQCIRNGEYQRVWAGQWYNLLQYFYPNIQVNLTPIYPLVSACSKKLSLKRSHPELSTPNKALTLQIHSFYQVLGPFLALIVTC